MPILRPLLITALLFLCAAPDLTAQAVAGTLVDEATGAPVSGAFVVLLDEQGSRRAGTLSDDAGRFQLTAPAPGRYSVRADRIGHRSALSPLLDLRAGSTLPYRMSVAAEAIALDGITVEGESRCEVRPEEGEQTALLWEEARKALDVSAWVQENSVLSYQTVQYERDLEPERMRVTREQTRPKTAYHSGSPFVSIPVERLASGGYIQAIPGSEDLMYYAPDAQVLLSDTFLDGHCFRVRPGRGAEEGLVGLAFEPVDRRQVSDVEGVLWLDRQSAELRHLEFTYTRLPEELVTDKVGGRVEFQRVPSGPWVVRRWWIRAPAVGIRELRAGGGPTRRRAFLAAVRETGAEVVAVKSAAGTTLLETELAALSGVVFDSTRARPLSGATVTLVGTEHADQTDGDGAFHLAGLSDGEYQVRISGPRLDSLGVELPTRDVRLVRGEIARIMLAVPSMKTILAAACPEGSLGDGAILVGSVTDANSGLLLAGAEVNLASEAWDIERDLSHEFTTVENKQRLVTVQADREGRFSACGLPNNTRVLVWASTLGLTSDTVAIARLAPGEVRQEVLTVHLPRVAAAAAAEGVVELEGVVATGRSAVDAARRAEGNSHVARISRPEIEEYVERGARNVAEALRMHHSLGVSVAGLMAGPNQVGQCLQSTRSFQQRSINAAEAGGQSCAMVELMVDGARIDGAGAPRYLQSLLLFDIESVEFLPPMESSFRFGSMNSAGTLIVTTRQGGTPTRR